MANPWKPHLILGILAASILEPFTALGQVSAVPTARPAVSRAVVAASQPSANVEEERFDDGKVKARYSLLNGRRSGPYTLFDEDGRRVGRGNYRFGKLDGVQQTVWPTGKPRALTTYHAGELDGESIEYDDKGRPTQLSTYRAGKLNGVHREFQNGVAVVESGYVDGLLAYPRSPQMIAAGLARIRATKIVTVGSDKAIPAHAGGNLSQQDREQAVRLLMEYRFLCGVPYEAIELDAEYNAHDEAATALLAAIGKLDHTPANPGWPDDRYQFAYAGTSHSNLFSYSAGATCVESVREYMDDSDTDNIARVGHRRWCLNPPMGKVGFAASGEYSSMWSFDDSREKVPDFEFVAYPGPGYFPASHFAEAYAWSVSVNESKYRRPKRDAKVTVTPVRVMVAQGEIRPAGAALPLDTFNVETSGIGIPNCIIFRPRGVSVEPGAAYLVDIQGLRTVDDKEAELRYVVEFMGGGR